MRVDAQTELVIAADIAERLRISRARISVLATRRGRFLRVLEGELRADAELPEEDMEVVTATAGVIYDQLSRLRDEERDDVWARVLEQFVAPYLLEPVDLVVGNPPWVSWKNLPDAWKQRSEAIWRSWGLWRTRGGRQGAPLSDISTLMVARAITTYAPNGIVAMLLPQSTQLADPGGNAFRRSHLRPELADRNRVDPADVPFRILAGDDLVRLNPFSPDAANMTIALYFRPNEAAVFPAPYRRWRRVPNARIRAEWSWLRAAESLEHDDAAIEPVEAANFSSPWGLSPLPGSLPLRSPDEAAYSLGRGYETRGLDGLFTFEITTPAPAGPQYQIRVRNDPEAGDNTRGEEPREGVVEANLFWPVVKGEDVTRWRVATTGRYWLVPYTVGDDGAEPVTLDDASANYSRLVRYLEPWLGRYGDRAMYQAEISDEVPWALSGPLEHLRSDGALLFVRYIGSPVAAVREPANDQRLGRTTLPIPNNKSNIYYTRSIEEAHFMAAFINSAPAQGALARFAVSTGVTPAALARLPLPRFDPEVEPHRELAALGAAASQAIDDPEELAAIEDRINEAVWAVVGGDADMADPVI